MDIRGYQPSDESSVVRLWAECDLVRSTNAAVVAFYEKLGYAQDQTISLGKRLISDEKS